jgi:hypothetical protein
MNSEKKAKQKAPEHKAKQKEMFVEDKKKKKEKLK